MQEDLSGEDFRAATRVTRIADDRFEAHVPDGWQQGRGAFGGLVFGTLLRAAIAAEPDAARLVRTFSCDVAGPVLPGRAELRVRVLRRGRSQTNLHVELEQAGAVQASSLCTLALPRPLDPTSEAKPHAPAFPEEARSDWSARRVAPPVPGGPVFATHYEYRNTGPAPFRGGPVGVNAGFIREVGARGTLDVPAICALLDAYWPALFTTASRPGSMLSTTSSFAAQFVDPAAALPADEPLYFRGRTISQCEGYDVEFRELWSRDRLVALNQQTFVILR